MDSERKKEISYMFMKLLGCSLHVRNLLISYSCFCVLLPDTYAAHACASGSQTYLINISKICLPSSNTPTPLWRDARNYHFTRTAIDSLFVQKFRKCSTTKTFFLKCRPVIPKRGGTGSMSIPRLARTGYFRRRNQQRHTR